MSKFKNEEKFIVDDQMISCLVQDWATFIGTFDGDNHEIDTLRLHTLLCSTAKTVLSPRWIKGDLIKAESKANLKGVLTSFGEAVGQRPLDPEFRDPLNYFIEFLIDDPWPKALIDSLNKYNGMTLVEAQEIWTKEGGILLPTRIEYYLKGNMFNAALTAAKVGYLVGLNLHEAPEEAAKVEPPSENPPTPSPNMSLEDFQRFRDIFFLLLIIRDMQDELERWVSPENAVDCYVRFLHSDETKNLSESRIARAWEGWWDTEKIKEGILDLMHKSLWRVFGGLIKVQELDTIKMLTKLLYVLTEEDGVPTREGRLNSEIFEDLGKIVDVDYIYAIVENIIEMKCDSKYDGARDELFLEYLIRALTEELNRITAARVKEQSNVAELEAHLSSKYLMAREFLIKYPRTSWELSLTAFSLNPTPELLHDLFNPVGVTVEEIFSKHNSQNELELITMKQSIIDDLCGIIKNPGARISTLSWVDDVGALQDRCKEHLEKRGAQFIASNELKNLEIDYKKFENNPVQFSNGFEIGYLPNDKRFQKNSGQPRPKTQKKKGRGVGRPRKESSDQDGGGPSYHPKIRNSGKPRGRPKKQILTSNGEGNSLSRTRRSSTTTLNTSSDNSMGLSGDSDYSQPQERSKGEKQSQAEIPLISWFMTLPADPNLPLLSFTSYPNYKELIRVHANTPIPRATKTLQTHNRITWHGYNFRTDNLERTLAYLEDPSNRDGDGTGLWNNLIKRLIRICIGKFEMMPKKSTNPPSIEIKPELNSESKRIQSIIEDPGNADRIRELLGAKGGVRLELKTIVKVKKSKKKEESQSRKRLLKIQEELRKINDLQRSSGSSQSQEHILSTNVPVNGAPAVLEESDKSNESPGMLETLLKNPESLLKRSNGATEVIEFEKRPLPGLVPLTQPLEKVHPLPPPPQDDSDSEHSDNDSVETIVSSEDEEDTEDHMIIEKDAEGPIIGEEFESDLEDSDPDISVVYEAPPPPTPPPSPLKRKLVSYSYRDPKWKKISLGELRDNLKVKKLPDGINLEFFTVEGMTEDEDEIEIEIQVEPKVEERKEPPAKPVSSKIEMSNSAKGFRGSVRGERVPKSLPEGRYDEDSDEYTLGESDDEGEESEIEVLDIISQSEPPKKRKKAQFAD